MTPALELHGVVKRFGGLVAVADVDLHVDRGEIAALVGPNGAGKTTLFNCITGELAVDRGRIELDGRDVTRLPVHARSRAGLARTFQRLEVFGAMTVLDNLQVAVEARTPGGAWLNILNLGHGPEARARRAAEEVLARVGLDAVADQAAAELPAGTLRMVELARALCTQPGVLLLDEPGSGLDDAELRAFKTVIAEVAAAGVAVLLAEHDIELVMGVSDTVWHMEDGQIGAVSRR